MKKVLVWLLLFSLFGSANDEIWNQEKLLQSFIYRGYEHSKQMITSATKEQLNETVTFRGEKSSLLGFLMQIIEDKTILDSFVHQIVEKGVLLESKEDEYVAPLAVAMQHRKWKIAQYLLESGAAIDVLVPNDYYRKVPLFYMAISKEKFDPFVELALPYNPKLTYNEEVKKGYTYLELALKRDTPLPNLVGYILRHGEKADVSINDRRTAYQKFLYANMYNSDMQSEKYQKRLEVLNILLDAGVPPIPKIGGATECYSPLYIVLDNSEMIQKLMDKGMNPNQMGCFLDTNFALSAFIGHLEAFKKLFNAGGDLFLNNRHTPKNISSVYRQCNDAFSRVMDGRDGAILKWLFINHKEVFTELSSSDALFYLKLLIENREDGQFFDVIDFLLNRSENREEALKEILEIAIDESKSKTATYLERKNSTKVQNVVWSRGLKSNMVDWLLDHKVSPFTDGQPLFQKIVLEELSFEQLKKLVTLYPKDKPKKKILDELAISILSKPSKDFLKDEEKLTFLKSYGFDLNTIETEDGEDFLSVYIRNLIARNDKLKLLKVILLGARVIKENQEHYIDSAYLRGLVDRAGVEVQKVDFMPKDEEEREDLNSILSYSLKELWYKKYSKMFGNLK